MSFFLRKQTRIYLKCEEKLGLKLKNHKTITNTGLKKWSFVYENMIANRFLSFRFNSQKKLFGVAKVCMTNKNIKQCRDVQQSKSVLSQCKNSWVSYQDLEFSSKILLTSSKSFKILLKFLIRSRKVLLLPKNLFLAKILIEKSGR